MMKHLLSILILCTCVRVYWGDFAQKSILSPKVFRRGEAGSGILTGWTWVKYQGSYAFVRKDNGRITKIPYYAIENSKIVDCKGGD